MTGKVISQSAPPENMGNDPRKACSQIPNAALVKLISPDAKYIPIKHEFVREGKPVKFVIPAAAVTDLISPRQYRRTQLSVFYDGRTEPAIAKFNGFTALRQQQQGGLIQRKVLIRTDHSLGPLPPGSVVTPVVSPEDYTPLWGLVETWESQGTDIFHTVCHLGYALDHLHQYRIE